MNPNVLFLFILLITACSNFMGERKQNSVGESNQINQNWISLFNGKDLTGWDIKIVGCEIGENYKNNVRVEDGMIRITYDEFDQFDERFGHIYYQQPYSHYKLRFEYRFVGEQLAGGASWNVRNSGIMVHSQSVQSVGKDQHFPVSIEVQLLGGLGEGERTTANLCTPGTMVEMDGMLNRTHCINSTSKTYHGDQWVKVEVVVLGDEAIHHIIEGDTVLSYQKPQIDGVFVDKGRYDWEQAYVPDGERWKAREGELLKSGYIALQAESHPIDFKNIELLELKKN